MLAISITKKLTTTITLLAALAGCKPHKASDVNKDLGSAGSAASGSSGTGTTVAATKPGAIDAAMMAAAKKVTTDCKWNDDGYYPYDCEANKAWQMLSFEKASAPTLVAVLEDKTPGMQFLGADQLYKHDWLADDKALQEKVFAVAEALPKDQKGGTANKLGRTIGFFDLEKTGLIARAKAIVEKPDANENLRVGIVNWLLAGNQASEAAYTLTRDQAKSGTPPVKVAALVALSAAYNKHATDEMCAMWLEALPTLDDKPAAMIASHLTKGDLQVNNQNEAFPYNWAMISSDDNKCPAATVDAALKAIEKFVVDGKAQDYWWTTSLKGPMLSKNATPAQKAAAVEIAKKYADNAKYGGYERGAAIELLVDLDATAAKAMVEKYANDKDGSLKSAAERAAKKLAEKKT